MAMTGSPIGGVAQGMWNDQGVLKQYASATDVKPPQGIGERLGDALARLHGIEGSLANANDRIYGSVPRGVATQAGTTAANHLAILSEITDAISRCEEEIRRLDRGL